MFYQKHWIALSSLIRALGSIHQVLAFISISAWVIGTTSLIRDHRATNPQIFSTAFFGTLSFLAAFGLGTLLIAGVSG